MKKSTNFTILLFALLSFVSYSLATHAQVTIGSNDPPLPGTLLQLKETESISNNANRGLILPRVNLTNLTPVTPAALAASIGGTGNYDMDEHIGLTVYNVMDNLCSSPTIAKGIYIWDGSVWTSLLPVASYPAITSVVVTPATACGGGTILSGIVNEGATIRWYTALAGGTLIGTGTNLSVIPAANTTYYGEAYNPITNCVSSAVRQAVTVAVNANIPPAPTLMGAISSVANSAGNMYSTESGMTDYVWTVTGGTITSGTGTNTIIVTWGAANSGSVGINYTNAVGCTGTTTTTVTLKEQELGITSEAGTLTGKVCFDIALSNDDTNDCGALSSRLAQQADFTKTSTNTQIYIFTPKKPVSNVRFFSISGNGSIIQSIVPNGNYTGNNISTPCSATVVYFNTLNVDAFGKYTNGTGIDAPLTADIYAIYNNDSAGTGIDVIVKLPIIVKDCSCCGAFIAPGVWKNFMCHNLGADVTKDPLIPVKAIHGNYYQWGRIKIVGDAAITSEIPSDWNKNIESNGAWNSGTEAVPVKTITDPCPRGYRVPTNTEWLGVIANNPTSSVGIWDTGDKNYTKFDVGRKHGENLLLPIGGRLSESNGALLYRGRFGVYSSSTEDGATNAYYMDNNSTNAYMNTNVRRFGFMVRCISEK